MVCRLAAIKNSAESDPALSVCQDGVFHLTQTDIWDKFTAPLFPSPSHVHRVQGPRLEKDLALQRQPLLLMPFGRHGK